MITIYHMPRTRSVRLVWLMEELGEEYRIERLSMPVPESYLSVSPTGAIPAIDDGGIRMTGSIAILQYLTGRRLVAGDETAKALTVGPLPDPAAYAEHLQFLHFGEADLATPISAIFRGQLAAKDGDPSNPTFDWLVGALAKRLAMLDNHFADGRTWITGGASIGTRMIGRFALAGVSLSATSLEDEAPTGTKTSAAADRVVLATWPISSSRLSQAPS